MAITPGKAGKVTKNEIAAVEASEKRVDIELQKRYQGSGEVRITADLAKLPQRCLSELLRRYRRVGWAIKSAREESHPCDPRGANYDYWMFSAAPPVSSSSLGHQIANSAPQPWS